MVSRGLRTISPSARLPNFLARHLGGLAEPIHPEELTKSTIEVKEGAAELSLPQ